VQTLPKEICPAMQFWVPIRSHVFFLFDNATNRTSDGSDSLRTDT
jgi:hypothetical protein